MNSSQQQFAASRKDDEPIGKVLVPAGELATMLDVSERTVWRLLSANKLIKPIRLGGNVRWRLDEVKSWIAAGCPPQENQRGHDL